MFIKNKNGRTMFAPTCYYGKVKERTARKVNRFSGHDYNSDGSYFVTVCAKDKHELFGEIKGGDMRLSDVGKAVESAMWQIPRIYKQVDISTNVIMPNHMHMILRIFGCAEEHAPTLSRIIKQFKGVVTKQVGYSPWQKSFHDRLIRDKNEYDNVVHYINTNITNWDSDIYRNNT